jgi:hypothetical protein
VDQWRQDFWGDGACKCDTHKALDFPDTPVRDQEVRRGGCVSLTRESAAGEWWVVSVRILNAFANIQAAEARAKLITKKGNKDVRQSEPNLSSACHPYRRGLYFLPTTWTREQLGSNNDF